MTTSMFIPQPHEDSNQIRISPWKNIQKTRKANKDIERRLNNYWDLKGKYQREYDARLDLLPEEGVADTVSICIINFDGGHISWHWFEFIWVIDGFT